MKHYSEDLKWSLIRSYYESGQSKDSYKKKNPEPSSIRTGQRARAENLGRLQAVWPLSSDFLPVTDWPCAEVGAWAQGHRIRQGDPCRGLQMLLEEGSIPHALMLCGPSGSKTCHRFLQKWPSGSKNRPRFHQKTKKTTYSVDGIIKKRKKPAFPTLGKVKISRFLRFSLERKSISISMTEDYNPTDKAVAESINGKIKVECVYRTRFDTFGQAREVIARYIHFSTTAIGRIWAWCLVKSGKVNFLPQSRSFESWK